MTAEASTENVVVEAHAGADDEAVHVHCGRYEKRRLKRELKAVFVNVVVA